MTNPTVDIINSKAAGRVCWESPANIALIKYWGKLHEQIPMNPSISFVLRDSVVKICLDYDIDPGRSFGLNSFQLNGTENEVFSKRIESYLKRLQSLFPFLKHTRLRIESHSTFPHSAGIASSAAAFSALALCICSVESKLQGGIHDEKFYSKASFMARLGSGSACRSLYSGMVLWGASDKIPYSSDEYAIRLDDARIHPLFMTLKDAVLIADDSKKEVSSSQGHALMEHHPYRQERIMQSRSNLSKLLLAMAGGNTSLFAEVVENEALSLHGLMMSSNPPYILMKPSTISMMEKIRLFRKENETDICFTLDAGPNIHLLYFEKDAAIVTRFIREELAPLCRNGRWINDAMGDGPKCLISE
ncbi:MAG: diphosphomevalonate decarboxylase [Bacteroidales bacterium]|nr:diphosphomevalonate decarboxylase [Bacteroidales bacterium]